MPVSAIGEFAHNLHNAQRRKRAARSRSSASRRISAPAASRSNSPARWRRKRRVVLVGLGAGDAAIRAISGDPSAPGLAELADGEASFGDIITKDRMSGLNLIVSGRAPAAPGELVSAPGMIKNFKALAYTYGHVVIDVGVVDGVDWQTICRASRSLPRTRSCWSRRCRTSAPTKRATAWRPPASTTSPSWSPAAPTPPPPAPPPPPPTPPPPRRNLNFPPPQSGGASVLGVKHVMGCAAPRFYFHE